METVCSILPTIFPSSRTRAIGFLNALYNSPWEKSIGLILMILTTLDHQRAIRDISYASKEIGNSQDSSSTIGRFSWEEQAALNRAGNPKLSNTPLNPVLIKRPSRARY